MNACGETDDENDVILCIEHMELNVAVTIHELLNQIDARDGHATGARGTLRHLLGNMSVISRAYLAQQLDRHWRERAEELLRRFAPQVPDVVRTYKKIDPMIVQAVETAQHRPH